MKFIDKIIYKATSQKLYNDLFVMLLSRFIKDETDITNAGSLLHYSVKAVKYIDEIYTGIKLANSEKEKQQ